METGAKVRSFLAAGAVAALAALGASSPAYGGGCPGNLQNVPSSIQQYTEQNPTACGTHVSGSGTHHTKLPKTIQRKIQKQAPQDAAILTRIATSEAAGAPQTPTRSKRQTAPKANTKSKAKGTTKAHAKSEAMARSAGYKEIVSDSAKHSNPLAASVAVVTDGSDGRLIAMLALMVGVAVILVVMAVRRRRLTR
jgi:cobalamin biosynthesis Mg chelatase CobN